MTAHVATDPFGDRHVTAVPKDARAFQGRRAGVVTRVLAGMADLVVTAVLIGAAYLAYGGLLFALNPTTASFPDLSRVFLLVAAVLTLIAYLTLAWATTGRSYGGRLMGLRVVNHRGDRMRLGGAFLRALLSVGFPAGLFWAAVSPANRAVADVLLRTSVIYDWASHPARELHTGPATPNADS